MSSKSTVIWLLVAIILGAAAFLLMRSGGGGTGPGVKIGDRLITLDSTAVTGIDVRHPDGGSESLARSGAMEWTMIVRPAGAAIAAGETRPTWPVVGTRVQALLRHLTDVTVRAVPDQGATIGDRPVTVDILINGATAPLTLRLANLSVAGKAMIEIDDPTAVGSHKTPIRAIVDDHLHLIFRDHAPREWRERQALYGLGLDASRLALDNDKGVRLALGKVDGAWSVREPVSAPADPAMIQRLLSSLASVQIVDFLDQGVAGAGTRLDKPAAMVTIESDRREPGAAAASRRLEIGGASDAAGTRLFARVDGDRVVVIDARAVAELKLEPTTFIWPFPTRLLASDIGTIALEPIAAAAGGSEAATPGVIFKRNLDKWMHIRADGQSVQLPSAETMPVEALLAFLCGPPPNSGGGAAAPAGPMSILLAPPPNHRVLGRITLLSLSGGPLETLELGTHQPGLITLKTGPIYRAWALDRLPSRLSEFVSALMAPPAPTGPAGATEPSK